MLDTERDCTSGLDFPEGEQNIDTTSSALVRNNLTTESSCLLRAVQEKNIQEITAILAKINENQVANQSHRASKEDVAYCKEIIREIKKMEKTESGTDIFRKLESTATTAVVRLVQDSRVLTEIFANAA